VTTAEFLSILRERGVRVWVENGRLKADAPAGILDDALRGQLAAQKRELMELVSQTQVTLSGPRSLVPLKSAGSQPPLFARPGHNGDVFCYRALADHLDPDRPLYGVEPKGSDGGPTADTVEEMAQYEVAQIRSLQPHSPYFIAGFCAGGTITFESARQLAHAGEEVARVLLFGSPFPTVYRGLQVRSMVRSLSERGRRHASTIVRADSVSDAVHYVRDRAQARSDGAATRRDPSLANRRRIEDATIEAVKSYEPGFYAGRVDVFLPSEAWRRSGDRPNDWKLVASEVVEHVGSDGTDGDNMLLEPRVRALANLLNPTLRPEEE
jgi:thioesterase domain-containing protein